MIGDSMRKRFFSAIAAALVLLFCVFLSSAAADSVVVFNEIMYHPADGVDAMLEWVELYNQMAIDIDISGWSVKGAIDYTFEEGACLAGGGYLVLVKSPVAFESVYGIAGAFGPFDGQLSNAGERIKLINNSGRLMDSVEYNDRGPWPVAPDGSGVSLAKKASDNSSSPAENWTSSVTVGGTPGAENFPVIDLSPRQVNLTDSSSTWRYDASGTDFGISWSQSGFNDAGWSQGQAAFYCGDKPTSPTPVPVTTLYSTGLDDDGNPLTAGQADPHYTFSSGDPIYAIVNHPAWLANDSQSQWISFGGIGTENQPVGEFPVKTTFDLTGWDHQTVSLNLQMSADNGVTDVLLNGTSLGLSWNTYNAWSSVFVIDSGFVTGVNELKFLFFNEGPNLNPAGLRVNAEATAIRSLGTTEIPVYQNTIYFRKTFSYDKLSNTSLDLRLNSIFDDGAVFYLNGNEIARRNMPVGTIDFNDKASSNVTDPIWGGTISVPAADLVDGLNTLSVEVHQAAGGAGDMFFDATLSVIETPQPPGQAAKVAFSEIAAANSGSFWLELVNNGEASINLSGMTIVADGETAGQYTFSSQMLAAGQYVAVTATQLGFIPTDEDRIFLYNANADEVLDAAVVKDTLQGRVEPMGLWYSPLSETPGSVNVFNFNTDIVINEIMYHKGDIPAVEGEYATTLLVAAGDMAKTLVPQDDSAGMNWTGGNEPFDDSAWNDGTGDTTGIGYDENPDYGADIGTDIYSDIYNENQSFYVRIPFTMDAVPVADSMTLAMKYDDGFVAYLNGTEIARRNAPTLLEWNSPAAGSHEAIGYEKIDISNHINLLKTGGNILAIHGLNYGVRSSDLLILPELSINERTTAPVPGGESSEEWLELYNKGTVAVDLTGWELDGAVDFDFPAAASLNPGEYWVVAKDAALMSQLYPMITIIGEYSGNLSNDGELVELIDAAGNPADSVRYYDDKPWPYEADGFNASLELRDPRSDNSNAQSWAASNESVNSQWTTYSYRGIAQASAASAADSLWREFVIGLLDAGEILIDDMSVIEDPDGSQIELLQNGTFEALPGDSKWRIVGNHRHSSVIEDPDNSANHVLRLVATGPTEYLHNHLETTFADGRSVVNGREYEITFRAKWVSGSNQLHTRLYFNRLAKTNLIENPVLNGTPGSQNSCYEANIGPLMSQLNHFPAVPDSFEPVTISVNAADPDGINQMILFWRPDGESWNQTAMILTDGNTYETMLDAQPAATNVQFYIQAIDTLGDLSTYPAAGADSRAMYRVNDTRAASNGLHNIRIIMTDADDTWMHQAHNVMSNDRIGATVIYDESRIYYDVGVRLKGSEHHRFPDNEVGFNVAFHADDLFRGVHKTVAIDRSEGIGFGQREMLIFQAANHAGGIVSKYHDLIKVIPNQSVHTSAAELQMARYNDIFLDSTFDNGSDGTLYEYELVYHSKTTLGGEEDYKLPVPDSYSGTRIQSLGSDKEDYRWFYLLKNNRSADPFDDLIDFAAAFGDTANLHEVIDMDVWLSSFAIVDASGAGDNYGDDGFEHNAMFYIRPSDGKMLYLPHDMDLGYSVSNPIIGNSDLSRMLTVPAYERLYYGYLYHLATTSYNANYMSRIADNFGQLLPEQPFSSHLSYIGQRSNYIFDQIDLRVAPQYDFAVTGPNLVVAGAFAAIHGTAWIDMKELYLDGIDEPLELDWTLSGSGTSKQFFFTATVPVEPGVNNLTFRAYDFQNRLIATHNMTVTSTITERPLRDYLRVTEIMYDPAGGSDEEFIELQNTSGQTLDLTHVTFTDGITFDFSTGGITSLASGEYVLVVKDLAAFSSRYDTAGLNIAGEFSGKLSNDGETVTLQGQWASKILSLTYADSRGWPLAADGAGHSLVPVYAAIESQADGSADFGPNWRASTYLGGSPGTADPQSPDSVVINEVCAHTDFSSPSYPDHDSNDWIELYNPSGSTVIFNSDWYLSDDKNDLKKWSVGSESLAVGQWISFDEISDFHNPITSGFGLDKAGEQVFLSYLPGNENDRVVDCLKFKGQPNGFSLSRVPDGGQFWYETALTRDSTNAEANPVCVISEFMYHPGAGGKEYIELKNLTASPLTLWDNAPDVTRGWRLDGGVSFEFSELTTIPADGFLLVVGFDPNEANLAAFNNYYGTTLTADQVVGPYAGDLSNNTERIALERPQASDDPLNPNDLSWIIVDEAIYFDQAPWPYNTDGTGQSVQRKELTIAGNNPKNWQAKTPSLGLWVSLTDFDANGIVDIADLIVFAQAWLSETGDANWNADCNIATPANGNIDLTDFAEFTDYWQ